MLSESGYITGDWGFFQLLILETLKATCHALCLGGVNGNQNLLL